MASGEEGRERFRFHSARTKGRAQTRDMAFQAEKGTSREGEGTYPDKYRQGCNEMRRKACFKAPPKNIAALGVFPYKHTPKVHF